MSRFYNPGFAWNDTLKFDNPIADAREANNVSYYRVEAPQKGFFEVKDTMSVDMGTGESFEIPLRFKDLIRTQYAERGVVLVSPGRECGEEENIAPDDDEAKKKGNRIWKEYLRSKANEWHQIVYEVKASGQLPRAATGLFKRVLEELGMEDPADTASGFAKAKEGQQSNREMQETLAAMQRQIDQLTGALNARKTA